MTDFFSAIAALVPSILLTFKVAGLATLLSSIFAILIAFFMVRRPSRYEVFIDSILKMPLVLPPTVLGYYLLVLLGRNGLIGQLLAKVNVHLIFTWQGAVIASAVVAFPLIYSNIKAALQSVPAQQIQAAQLLGLNAAKVFTRVELPLSKAGIIAGILLGFARALGEFGATFMIAGSLPGQAQTLSIAIYEAVQAGRDYEATFMVIVLSMLALVIMVATGYLGQQRRGAL